MSLLHLLFRSRQFNLTQVGKDFINPCCFGEDLAAWLRPRLAAKNVATAEPYQEDWGWELPAAWDGRRYYLCMSGNADDPDGPDNEGEWHIIVEKRRSIFERLAGKEKLASDDPLVARLEEVLSADAAIRNLRRE
jgi:hypothetical protein